jgi:glycosyltransferase involved in cell wall biosynthesis
MKILMLGWELPPHNSGGLGVACYYMSQALAQQGVSIDFVLPYTADHDDVTFMTVHAATNENPLFKTGMGAYYSSRSHSIQNIQKKYTRFVLQLAKTSKPHVVHAHDWLTMDAGIAVKQAQGTPLIVHVHATEFDRSGETYGNPLVHDIEQEGLMMADRIIAVSDITKQMIVKRYHIPEEKIEVIHNSINPESLAGHIYDTNTYLYLESLKQEGYSVVSSIGRLTIQKGLHYFLHAAARASEKCDTLLFLIAGDGEQRDELIQLSADLGIADKIFFTGFVRGRAWRDAYAVSDMFVMSSVSEPFGLTALEAAAHDTAVLISKQSGVGEVMHNVFRFDYWDIDRLADQMIAINSSQALRETLVENVYNEFQHMSWSKVADKITHLYRVMNQSQRKTML